MNSLAQIEGFRYRAEDRYNPSKVVLYLFYIVIEYRVAKTHRMP